MPDGSATKDAHMLAAAINSGWIVRGFKLGLGFWLSSLFIGVLTFVLFAIFGVTLLGALQTPPALESAAVAPVAPSDNRDWREQLRASDRARAEMQRNLAAKAAEPSK